MRANEQTNLPGHLCSKDNKQYCLVTSCLGLTTIQGWNSRHSRHGCARKPLGPDPLLPYSEAHSSLRILPPDQIKVWVLSKCFQLGRGCDNTGCATPAWSIRVCPTSSATVIGPRRVHMTYISQLECSLGLPYQRLGWPLASREA